MSKAMTRGIVAMGLLAAIGAVQAADSARTTEQVIQHHMQAIASGKVDDILKDYADNAVLIDPSGTNKGKAAIGAMFTRMLSGAKASPSPPDKQVYEGDIGFISWTPASVKSHGGPGAETYVVRHGLIEAQVVTLAGQP